MKIFTILLLALSASVFGCSQPRQPKAAGFDEFFPQKIGGAEFKARIALTENEKARGLMRVKSLGEREGMIFAGDFPRQASFWMYDTHVALDIAFIDANGKILEIRQMYPHDQTPVRSVSAEVVHCVEMPRGFFEKNSVKAGESLDMRLFADSLKKRRGEK
ncbi:MAG: DUF192 domain-containing protein [Opitutales bacterium]|nr:DUF192 domain-containing protein [Opitutales bacterium]